MKKALSLILVLAAVLVLSACNSAPVQTVAPTAAATTLQPSATALPKVVAFTDEVLEGLVRKAMNKPSGDITVAEAQAVKELNLEMEGGKPIPRVKDIRDLSQFPNLVKLNLDWALYNDGKPVDISPLAGLVKLEYLYICCDDIYDISPLKGLVNMKDLWIWGNRYIKDISSLSGMTQLDSLCFKGNQIPDISVLSGMTGLTYLCMEDNKVSDLAPLAGLTKLKTLLISGNPATDLSPLKDVYKNLEEKDFTLK